MKHLFFARRITTFFVIISALFGFCSVSASSDTPLDQMKTSVEKLLEILSDDQLKTPEMQSERKKRVVSVVDGIFDFHGMARSSLAKEWQKISAEDQKEFVDLFSKLIKQRYIGKIDAYDGQKVVFGKEIIRGERALIYSTLQDNSSSYSMVYFLKKNQDKWLIINMKIENVSLVANYRSDFSSIIRKDKYAGLVKMLKDKVSGFKESW